MAQSEFRVLTLAYPTVRRVWEFFVTTTTMLFHSEGEGDIIERHSMKMYCPPLPRTPSVSGAGRRSQPDSIVKFNRLFR